MAYDINNVFIIGRLTKDPETRFSSNTAISKFSIANNPGKEEKDVCYFDVVVFGKTAEFCQQYLKKGKQIAIMGRLSQNRWEKDGQKFSKVEIIAQNIQFLDSKSSSGSNVGESSSYQEHSRPNENSFEEDSSVVIEEDDDIPF